MLALGALALASCGGSAEDALDVGGTSRPLVESTPETASTFEEPSAVVVPTTVTTPATSSTTTSSTTTSSTTTVAPPTATPHRVPVEDPLAAGWGTTHSSYPATDIFATCGTVIVSPVNGVLLEVRTVDGWDPAVDNPATRGGRSIAVLGDDGVRYYMAHFDVIEPMLAPGGRVAAGDRLGTMGATGRASACHLHFALSPPCPGKEWSVRRGVVWPYPYLDAWRRGEDSSPVDEIESWLAANPDACELAMADPYAQDS
jgi:murein DD-endopeptidase MepM/ murein hydrolase activator NlpD